MDCNRPLLIAVGCREMLQVVNSNELRWAAVDCGGLPWNA